MKKRYDSLSPAPQEESSAFPIPLPNPPAGMGMALALETEMEEMLQPPARLRRCLKGWSSAVPPPQIPPPQIPPPGRMYEQAHLEISAVAISTPANFDAGAMAWLLPFQNSCLTEGIPAASPAGTQRHPSTFQPIPGLRENQHHQSRPLLFPWAPHPRLLLGQLCVQR